MSFYTPNKRKIINDPLHGFITIPNELVYDIIETPCFQRLRRIKQAGLTGLVYPGALHTRFQHALGAMHLTQQAVETLKHKGFEISDNETLGVTLAILLHDIGHGPFSHALENCIVPLDHEQISLLFFEKLNKQFNNQLDTAIKIFTNQYPQKFLHQLVSSQLDMDRLDYLMRDSFFAGVSEGVVNIDRILKMLTIVNDELAVEEKGIYSIENFIVARRLMYWQVYFHKTVLAAESMLASLIKRAKELIQSGVDLPASPPLLYFLKNNNSVFDMDELLDHFQLLDDDDVVAATKNWMYASDPILKQLSSALVYRHLFALEIQNEPFDVDYKQQIRQAIARKMNLPEAEVSYLFLEGTITNKAYTAGDDKIGIADKKGNLTDISQVADMLNISVLAHPITKYYIAYPKEFRAT